MTKPLACSLVLLLPVAVLSAADDPVFSGPQPGERLAALPVKGVFGDDAGKEFDLVARGKGKPTLLVFFHERTRPAFGLARTLMKYADTRANDGLHGGVVFLTGDPTGTEQWMKQVQRHFATKETTYAISTDGQEGPGAYGLNRGVTLTVLVAKEDKVTANFALVQPSLQADGPKIAKALASVMGDEKPADLAKFSGERYRGQDAPARPNAGAGRPSPELANLVRSMINKQATPEEVAAAAEKVVAHVEKNAADRAALGRITNTIVDSGRLETYGTEKAREFIAKWAKAYKPRATDAKDDAEARRKTDRPKRD